jgi:hypothetical protein
MTTLEASRLFDRTLPEAFGPALDALHEIDELKHGSSLAKAERRERARALYARLGQELAAHAEPTPPELALDSRGFRAWFTEALLLWIRFARTGSKPLVDSVDAETLKRFPVDLLG